jgi:hypothetical protein
MGACKENKIRTEQIKVKQLDSRLNLKKSSFPDKRAHFKTNVVLIANKLNKKRYSSTHVTVNTAETTALEWS